jgi:HPt (histidine-containing phosphotransfer) domain-containing protein
MNKDEKEKILDELGGIDEADYDVLVTELIQDIEKRLAELESAIKADDFIGVSKIAHAIKGEAGNLRIYKIEALAKTLESEAKETRDRSKIAVGLERIIRELAELKAEGK